MLLSHVAQLLFLLGILQHALSSSSKPNNDKQFRSNPYDILRVDPECTQKEIQRSYRALCLKYHPDKRRNDNYSKVDSGAKGSKEVGSENDDFEFKEVQHAYSLIGTDDDRRNYDVMRKFNLHSTTNTKGRAHEFARYAASNQFGERSANDMFGSSATYFTFEDGVFKFSRSSGRNDNMFQRRGFSAYNNPLFREKSQHSRPHYVQKVSIPLDVLYSGKENFQFKLRTSIFERYKAAFRGGLLTPALMQGALTVLMTWLRSQKINLFLSAFLFVSMIHMQIPMPPEKVIYTKNIRPGWKGGTKIKYKLPSADVVFVLQERGHDTFTRFGNNLHTRVEVTARQLRKGCTLSINPLCHSDEPIQLKLRPKEVKNGQVVTIKSRGWPKGSEEKECGDLKVKICCTT